MALRKGVWLGVVPDGALGSAKAGSRQQAFGTLAGQRHFLQAECHFLFSSGPWSSWRVDTPDSSSRDRLSVGAFGPAQPHLCPWYSCQLKVISQVMYYLRLGTCPPMLSCHCYSQENAQILWGPLHSMNMCSLSACYVLGPRLSLGDFVVIILSCGVHTSPTAQAHLCDDS